MSASAVAMLVATGILCTSHKRRSPASSGSLGFARIGSIHHYFKSKDEILMLVARMLFESIRNDIDELYLARDEAGKREQLHELVGSCDRNRFVMMLYSLSLSMPEVKELVAGERALLFNALASRLKRGAKAVPNPEKSAASLLFFFESAIMQSALFDQAPAEDLLMEVLVDQLI